MSQKAVQYKNRTIRSVQHTYIINIYIYIHYEAWCTKYTSLITLRIQFSYQQFYSPRGVTKQVINLYKNDDMVDIAICGISIYKD